MTAREIKLGTEDDREVALQITGVSKAFGATQALDDAALSIGRGTIHALLGGNGSGKSTLIKVLAGVVQADSGVVTTGADRHDLRYLTPAAASASGLRFVHQQATTFPDLTVAENLRIGAGFGGGPLTPIRWKAVRQRAGSVIERFHIAARPDSKLSELGGATQMMVAIARVLQDREGVGDGVLLLDEPTASLPRHEASLLLSTLGRYAEAGQTIVYVTHRLDEVLEVATRATMLRDGQVVGTAERSDMSHDRLVNMMVGRELGQRRPNVAKRSLGKAVLEGHNLKGGRIESASLCVRSGEIVGIAGLLGSGRSTLLRLLFGVLPIEEGRLSVNGNCVRLRSAKDAIRAGVALVPEDRAREAAFPQLSIRENMSMSVTRTYWRIGYLHHRRERKDTRDLIQRFLIKAEAVDAPLSSLSGGNQQKVVLARWLRRRPAVLLLDEPTQGVDVGARAEIYDSIEKAAGGGMGVVVVSSEFEELETLCDRALVIRDGVISHEVGHTDMSKETLQELALGDGGRS